MATQFAFGKIVTDGLVLALDAADKNSYPGSGTTWADLSGNGNNGTLTNGPTFSSANGGSIVFDGTNDYIIDSSTVNMPTGSSSRTIQMWVYPTTNTNNFVQLGIGFGGNQVYIVQYYRIGSPDYIFTDGVNGGNNLTISGAQLPTLNTWNFVVFGNSGQNYFYYLNGVSRLTGTWPVTLNTVGQKYVIGNRDDGSGFNIPISGSIGLVNIYNRALTESEILQNYNAQKSRFGL
jgi:hypothetical protein